MTDIEPLPERVDRIEHKLDALSRFEGKLDHFEGKLDRFEGKFDEFVKSQASPPRRQRVRGVQKKR